MIGSPFAKPVLKKHFPPRLLTPGNNEVFMASFLLLAIISIAMVSSLPLEGGEGLFVGGGRELSAPSQRSAVSSFQPGRI